MKNGTYIKYYLSLPSSYHRINLMKILFFYQSIASVFHGRSWPYSFMWSGHFRELRRTGHKGIIKKVGRGEGDLRYHHNHTLWVTRSLKDWFKKKYLSPCWADWIVILSDRKKQKSWNCTETEERRLHFIFLYLICSARKGTWTKFDIL